MVLSTSFTRLGVRALAGLLCLSGAALAQTFPAKPVRAIISFTPGSSTDIVGRLVLQKVSELWGQPVVPENRAGAGGSIGTAFVASAPADGYTLLVDSSAHAITPAIYAKLPYDTLKDFVDIVPMTIQPNVYVVAADSGYKTLGDVINAAKQKQGGLNIGHAGIGSGTHLNTERFIAAAGIKVTQVPFKGTPDVIAAIFNGSVEGYWAPISAAMPQLGQGKLRGLAVSTSARSPQLPDIPTTGEAGVRGADSPLWFGVWGPAGLPRDTISRINADVRRALKDTTTRARLYVLGNDFLDMSPEQFARFVRDEVTGYAKVVKAAGLEPQ